MKGALLVGALAMLGGPVLATAEAQEMSRSESAEGAQAYIISPQNGEVVGRTLKVKFGLTEWA